MNSLLQIFGSFRTELSKEKQDMKLIKSYERKLASKIRHIVKMKEFYEFPIQNIWSIIDKVDFSSVSGYASVISTLIKNYVLYRGENSGVLLNFIHAKDCVFSIQEAVDILVSFRNCELCTKIAQSIKQELVLPAKDFEYEINKKEEEIKNLQKSNGFTPLSEAPDDLERNIFVAVEEGKLESVRYLIETENVDPESKDEFGRTPLHIACESSSNFPIIFYLLNFRNVAFNAVDNSNSTPLHVASSCGELPIVSYLIEKHGAAVDQKDGNGRTPLFLSCKGGFIHIAKYLIENAHAKVTIQNKELWTPLHAASANGHLNIVEYLIENQNVDTQVLNKDKDTAFDVAVKSDQFDVVKYLLKKTTVPTKEKEKLLFIAVKNDDISLVKDLVDAHGINYECYNAQNKTPLDIAIQTSKNEIIKYLINYYTNWIKSINEILDSLCKTKNNEIIDIIIDNVKLKPQQLLIILNYSCNEYAIHITKHLFQKLNGFGEIKSVAIWLCKRGYTSNTKYLFEISQFSFEEKGNMLIALITRQLFTAAEYLLTITETSPKEMENLLFFAIDSQSLDTVKFLIEKNNVNINCSDSNGNTPLHHAAKFLIKDIIAYLVSKNADTTIKNKENQTPNDIAKLNILKITLLNI